MSRKVFVLNLICFFGVLSCSISKNLSLEKVPGAYIHYGGNHNTTLDLFKGGTFRYQSFTGNGSFGILYEESYGKWHLDSASIVLSSYRVLDTTKPSYELFDVKYDGGDTLSLVVLDTNNETMPFVNCVVFAGDSIIDGASTDFDGKAILSVFQGDRIEFSFTAMTTVIFPLKDKRPSSLALKIYESQWPDYRYFQNEAWRSKGRKLVDPENGFYFNKKWPTPPNHYK